MIEPIYVFYAGHYFTYHAWQECKRELRIKERRMRREYHLKRTERTAMRWRRALAEWERACKLFV